MRVDDPLLRRSQLPDLMQEFCAHFQDTFDFVVVLADVQSNVAPQFQLVRNDIDGLELRARTRARSLAAPGASRA